MLNDHLKRALLKALEKKNQPLEQVELLSICNSNTEIYGNFANARRKSARNYIKELLRLAIPPSDATKVWEARESRMPSPDSTFTTGDVSMNGGDGGGDDISELADMFQHNASVKSSAPRQEPPPCAMNISTEPRDLPPSSSPMQRRESEESGRQPGQQLCSIGGTLRLCLEQYNREDHVSPSGPSAADGNLFLDSSWLMKNLVRAVEQGRNVANGGSDGNGMVNFGEVISEILLQQGGNLGLGGGLLRSQQSNGETDLKSKSMSKSMSKSNKFSEKAGANSGTVPGSL